VLHESAETTSQIDLYKIFLIFESLCTNQSSLYPPPAHLQCPHCCNTIERLLGNIRHLFDLPFVCHTPINIGNNNIV